MHILSNLYRLWKLIAALEIDVATSDLRFAVDGDVVCRLWERLAVQLYENIESSQCQTPGAKSGRAMHRGWRWKSGCVRCEADLVRLYHPAPITEHKNRRLKRTGRAEKKNVAQPILKWPKLHLGSFGQVRYPEAPKGCQPKPCQLVSVYITHAPDVRGGMRASIMEGPTKIDSIGIVAAECCLVSLAQNARMKESRLDNSMARLFCRACPYMLVVAAQIVNECARIKMCVDCRSVAASADAAPGCMRWGHPAIYS